MSSNIRSVRHLGSNPGQTLSTCQWCQVQQDGSNRGSINVHLKEPDEVRTSDRDSRTGKKMIVEINSDVPVKNAGDPEIIDDEVLTYLSFQDDGSDDMAMSQFYELEVDPPEEGWQVSLRTKDKDQEDPERDHRYVLISA